MTTYITSASLISPQPTFEGSLPTSPTHSLGLQLPCCEPAYKQILPPAQLRRMSRLLKMGMATSLQCTSKSAIQPDAIIVGTGRGCATDLEKFMHSSSEEDGQLLSPIPFINSGHNTLAGHLAMANQIKGYNMTYLQEEGSLTSALTDAMLLQEEGNSQCTLVGAIDEYSTFSYHVFDLLGEWRKTPVDNLDLLKAEQPGTIMGEGAAFFCLANQPAESCCLELLLSESRLTSEVDNSVEWIQQQLKKAGLTAKDISSVFVGRNGDQRADGKFYQPVEEMFPSATIATYKHLCGEYPTADGFALWMAFTAKSEPLPAYAIRRHGTSTNGATLIYSRSLSGVETLIAVK